MSEREESSAPSEEPPVADSERESWLDEARTALEDLQKQVASLRYGMGLFPPDFDKTDWREAFDAPVPRRNQCDTALLAFLVGIDEFNTAIQTGAVLDGLISPALKKDAGAEPLQGPGEGGDPAPRRAEDPDRHQPHPQWRCARLWRSNRR